MIMEMIPMIMRDNKDILEVNRSCFSKVVNSSFSNKVGNLSKVGISSFISVDFRRCCTFLGGYPGLLNRCYV
jgi:hypothetical protein